MYYNRFQNFSDVALREEYRIYNNILNHTDDKLAEMMLNDIEIELNRRGIK